MAAGGGVIACLLVSRIFFGKTNIIYALNGAISGLVAITAAPDTPTGYEAVLIGAAGIFGVMVVPLTAEGATLGAQALGVVSIFVWGFVLTYAFLYLINLISPVRASDAIQKSGLDAEEIGVEAYPEFK
mgnify:CR=1 FL=1